MRLATPGATLMQVTELLEGAVHVRCPGCGMERTYAAGVSPEQFEHYRDCGLGGAIAEVVEMYHAGVAEVLG
jgi:hypothetical protein